MAELNNTTQTQEPVYLNYGADQIDQQAFLDAAANNVQQYVNNQTWSAKRKQKFLNAYSDIMSKGIIGANNKTGQWAVDLNSNIDLESMDRKDQEMYHEAAYYILQQMKGITPKAKEEEEKKKSDLPVFNNDYFTEQFQGYIGNQLFGGRDWDRNTDWNVLDEADKYGIRGTNNRAEKLASMLEGYRNSLKEEDLNFEGSPFTDLNDFKTKVNNAIDQLRNKTWNQGDIDALNQIGINPETYMSTGANDMNPEGTMTRQQWKEALEKEEADKLAAEQKDAQAKALAQQQANAGVLSSLGGIHAVEAATNPQAYAEYLASDKGLNAVGQAGFNAMNQRIQGLIDKAYTQGLNADEKKQLGNLLYYIRQNNPNYQKSNLSDQDWAELNLHKNLGSTNRAGYVRLPWQTSDGRYTYADDKGNIYFLKPQNKAKIAGPAFNRSAAYNDYKNNFLINTKAGNKEAQQRYLNQEGAENAELYGIVADIASIIDPEPFSAMGLSLSAAGARNYAKLQQPGQWNWKDYGSQGLDYLTSVIGAIPVVGDAALATKVIRNLGRLGAWSDIVQSTPGLVDIWNNKIMGDQKMTKQDWRTVGTALRGLVSHGRLNQSNLAARKVMQERGIETGNSWHQRSGFTSSVKDSNKVDVLKITKNGKSDEIELTPKQKQNLEEAFRKAKPSERTKVAKEILKENFPEGAEVKVSDGIHSTVRNWNRYTRRTSDSFKTKSTPVSRENMKSDEEFENFLKGRSTWSKIGLGSNRYLRRIDKQLSSTIHKPIDIDESTGSAETIGTPYSQPKTQNNPLKEGKILNDTELPADTKLNREIMKEYRNIQNGRFSKKDIENGILKVGNENLNVYRSSSPGTGDFVQIRTSKETKQFKSLEEAKKFIASIVKEQRSNIAKGKITRANVKEIGKVLKDLKKKGWLKQGGQINNFDIDKTISEFLNKQK